MRQFNLVYEFDGRGMTSNFDAENAQYAELYAINYCNARGYKFISIEEIILH